MAPDWNSYKMILIKISPFLGELVISMNGNCCGLDYICLNDKI